MNPLLPLITSLASKNRDYVVFVGAGFSKDAGIPSGWDILIDSLKPVYIEDSKIVSPDEIKNEEIEKWYLSHPEYSKLGYSQLLELLYKGEIERRQHLKKYFENQQIGQSHKLLAQLVKGGFIRYIFTTNFDDLLEKALDEYSVNYDVISSDDILSGSVSWDRVKECRLYKLHGDYKAGKVKNTISELSSIDLRIADDFKYIIDRHGIIIIGYAGRDEGIMRYILEKNLNSYPIYWQLVDYPPETDEFKFFNKLKLKSDSDPNKINFIENPSASKFLQEIIYGIENLDRLMIVGQKNRNNYENYILNQNEKKIRALSLEIINDFTVSYEEYMVRANKERDFSITYKIFSECVDQLSYIFEYVEVLLKYNQDKEMEFFITQLLKYTSSQDWSITDDFLEPSFTYLLVSVFGTIILKYNKLDLIEMFYELLKKHHHNYAPLLNKLNLYHNGWLYVISQSEEKNSITPYFDIIVKRHLPKIISREEFISFQAYLEMDIALKNSNIIWYCNARPHGNICQDVFHNYFKKRITSEEQAILFLNNLIRSNRQGGWYPDGYEEIIKLVLTKFKREDLINSYLLKIS